MVQLRLRDTTQRCPIRFRYSDVWANKVETPDDLLPTTRLLLCDEMDHFFKALQQQTSPRDICSYVEQHQSSFFKIFRENSKEKREIFQIWKRVFDDKTSRAEIQSRSWRHSLDTPAVYIARDINYYSNSAKAQRVNNIRNKVFDKFRGKSKLFFFCFSFLKEMKIFLLLLLLEPRGEGIFTYTWV